MELVTASQKAVVCQCLMNSCQLFSTSFLFFVGLGMVSRKMCSINLLRLTELIQLKMSVMFAFFPVIRNFPWWTWPVKDDRVWSSCGTSELRDQNSRWEMHPIWPHAVVYFRLACVVLEPISSLLLLAQALTLNSGRLLANLGMNQRLIAETCRSFMWRD